LLPVTGIQLPLISAGGTATATTLLLIGLIANAARHEPEAVAALRAGRDDRMNRILRLPLPVPYSPTTLDSARDRLRSRTDGAAKAGRKPAKPTKPARPTRQARQDPPARQRRTDASKRTRGTAEPDRGRKKTVPADGAARRTRQNGDPRGQQRRDPRRSDRTVRTLEGHRYG
ncbi:FtsW/RodA/SpoVE family cell cycle protein, partial [Mycolicibacterium sp. CBMA 361]|uniref:FtsW/RodA/SpoVE family cell cycle protein n=2 Tax=Mycolicibacterium TaxID=1866885 RepID=UPI001396878C